MNGVTNPNSEKYKEDKVMDYFKFLECVINDGIETTKRDYSKPEDSFRLKGSIEGSESCRFKRSDQLEHVLNSARMNSKSALDAYIIEKNDDLLNEYWYRRCFEDEVEWVCNCISAIMINQGLESIIPPTARGMIKASEIIGMKGDWK